MINRDAMCSKELLGKQHRAIIDILLPLQPDNVLAGRMAMSAIRWLAAQAVHQAGVSVGLITLHQTIHVAFAHLQVFGWRCWIWVVVLTDSVPCCSCSVLHSCDVSSRLVKTLTSRILTFLSSRKPDILRELLHNSLSAQLPVASLFRFLYLFAGLFHPGQMLRS